MNRSAASRNRSVMAAFSFGLADGLASTGSIAASFTFDIHVLVIKILQLNRRYGHDCRNCMFIDKLYMLIALQENRKIIEPCYNSLQLDSIYEKNRNSGMGLTNVI